MLEWFNAYAVSGSVTYNPATSSLSSRSALNGKCDKLPVRAVDIDAPPHLDVLIALDRAGLLRRGELAAS